MKRYDEVDRQFRQADAAINRAVTAFVSKIDRIMNQCGTRWDTVAPSYIRDQAILAMSDWARGLFPPKDEDDKG